MAPVPQQAPGTRDALLEAALRAFTERGYGSTTMSEVRRAAGASTGSLYHHFPTREHLAAAVWLDALGRFQDGFAAAVRRARPSAAAASGDGAAGARSVGEAGVKAGVRFHARWCREHPDHARLLLGEQDPAVRAVAAEAHRTQNAAFFGAVRAWHAEQPDLRPLSFDLLSALWLGPSQELARHWLGGRAKPPSDATVRVLADAAWLALRRP